MNSEDRRLVPNQEATLEYGPGEFRVVRPGAYVRCAVTGQSIRLEDLKYWSIARQEAYATAALSLQRELQARPQSDRMSLSTSR